MFFDREQMCPEGDQPGADVGPLISPEAKARVESLIQSGVDEGAKILLDGRNVNVKGFENGNFVGPTILSGVRVRFGKGGNVAAFFSVSKNS